MFGRLAGYEDVNDAERLSRDPTMRTIVNCKGPDRGATSLQEMSDAPAVIGQPKLAISSEVEKRDVRHNFSDQTERPHAAVDVMEIGQ